LGIQCLPWQVKAVPALKPLTDGMPKELQLTDVEVKVRSRESPM
jgi:hypothetical protein